MHGPDLVVTITEIDPAGEDIVFGRLVIYFESIKPLNLTFAYLVQTVGSCIIYLISILFLGCVVSDLQMLDLKDRNDFAVHLSNLINNVFLNITFVNAQDILQTHCGNFTKCIEQKCIIKDEINIGQIRKILIYFPSYIVFKDFLFYKGQGKSCHKKNGPSKTSFILEGGKSMELMLDSLSRFRQSKLKLI